MPLKKAGGRLHTELYKEKDELTKEMQLDDANTLGTIFFTH